MNYLSQIVFILLCVIYSNLLVSAQAECVVKGRIVDENAQPVEQAFILLDSINRTYISDLMGIGVETDKNGVFMLKHSCYKSKKQRVIYITSPVSRSVKNVLLPPYPIFRDGKPLYESKPVQLKSNGVTNLGDMKIQTYYVVVKLALQNQSGKQLFADSLEQWGDVWLRVMDEKNRVVVDEGMSVEDYREHTETDGSALRVALPEGTWTIELLPNGKSGKIIARKTISVSKSTSPLMVDFVIEANK